MNTKHVKGAFNKTKGKIKQDIGHATGNDRLAGEGVIDRVKGKVQQGYGDLKDTVKRGVDKVLGDDRKNA